MSVKLSFDLTDDKSTNNIDKKTYNLNVDICKMSLGMMGGFFLTVINEQLSRSSNIKLSCPQPKNFYYVVNFQPLPVESLPVKLVALRGVFKVTALMKVKISRSKPFVNIFSLKIRGYT